MTRLRTLLEEPLSGSVIAFTTMLLVGAGMVGSSWRGVAAQTAVANQVPYLISAGLGGLAVIGFASCALCIQARRWHEALQRDRFDRVVRAASELLSAAQHRGTGRA